MNARRVAAAAGMLGLALAAAPTAGAQPPPRDPIRTYPIATGNYTTAGDFYFLFFKTPDGRSCGIGPNGGPVGCDAVPGHATPDTNQTIVNSWAPAEYILSDSATSTRDVDVLPEGYRLENWGATCAVEEHDAVRCETYNDHGFTLSADPGELW